MNPVEYRKSLEGYYAAQKSHEKEVEELQHWGIQGMRWGRRRYQNEDGSLTEEGRRRYGVMERREEYRSRERLERESTKAKIKATRAEADTKIKIAREQARANAEMQARIAKENAKAQALVAKAQAKAQGKAQAKIARAQAEADAEKAKVEAKSRVDVAKQDVKGLKAEAQEETKQKKIAAQVQIQDDRARAIQNNALRKLILGGAAVAGAVVIIKALRGKSVSSPEISKQADTGAKLLSENEGLKSLLQTKESELSNFKESYSAAQSLLGKYKDTAEKNYSGFQAAKNLVGKLGKSLTNADNENKALREAISRNNENAAQAIIDAFKRR